MGIGVVSIVECQYLAISLSQLATTSSHTYAMLMLRDINHIIGWGACYRGNQWHHNMIHIFVGSCLATKFYRQFAGYGKGLGHHKVGQ